LSGSHPPLPDQNGLMMKTAPHTADRSTATTRRRVWVWTGRLGAIAVLLIVFGAYRQPDMLMQMAQQLWSCFG
jgi:hypothetical protein